MAKPSRKYPDRTLKVLFGLANRCAFPNCAEPLVKPGTDQSDALVLAQICHILAASDKGPRADIHLSASDRDKAENLILLCPTHHAIIDGQHETYPPEMLRQWKEAQQQDALSRVLQAGVSVGSAAATAAV